MGEVDRDYIRFVEKSIAGGIYFASQHLRDAAFGIKKGNVTGIGYIREGRKGEVHPDPEIGVIKICDREDKPIAILTDYACHPVVLDPSNLLISADYPGVLQTFVEANTGAICFFLQGACGDIDPGINIGPPISKDRCCNARFKEVVRVGEILGAEVVKLSNQTPE